MERNPPVSTNEYHPTVKEALRRDLKARRLAISDEAEYASRSRAICDRAALLPELHLARVVHIYWPMTHLREVDTRPLIVRLHAQGKIVVLPVVRSFSRSRTEAPRLDHFRYEPGAELVTNRWGIDEPAGGSCVPLEEVDAFVVPALGVSRTGHRIGHGYGYYDELLHRSSRPIIILTYDCCIIPSIPFDIHDIPATIVVTETEVIRPSAL